MKEQIDREAIENYLQDVELRNQQAEINNINNSRGQESLNQFNEENLVKWQLDFSDDLEKIYHLLKGNVLVESHDGSINYEEAKDDSLKPFNEKGVQTIMNILRFYLSRNTILSNYEETTIQYKVLDFGNKISDLIFMKYEEMGMNTEEKRKLYPMIVMELVDTVHSAYLRALGGGERESLRKVMSVSQNQPLGQNQQFKSNERKFKMLKPSSWF